MSHKSLKLKDNFGVINVEVTSGETVQIGSGIERTITIDEYPEVLDLHAELRFENPEWILWDRSDGKGISVNNEPIQSSQQLTDGDEISIGSSILFVTIQQQQSDDSSVLQEDREIDAVAPTSIASTREPEDVFAGFRSNRVIDTIDTERETATSHPNTPDKTPCSKCGELIYQEAEICPHCGVRQKTAPKQTQSKRSRVAAGLLGIFLGSFGLHKFYLGQTGWGFLYLIFFWAYVPGIAGFIEGIIYLTMDDEKFTEKYG